MLIFLLDIDDDGVLNKVDNCVYVFNPNQSDVDGDKVGGNKIKSLIKLHIFNIEF